MRLQGCNADKSRPRLCPQRASSVGLQQECYSVRLAQNDMIDGALDAASAALDGMNSTGGALAGPAAASLPVRAKAVALATVAEALDKKLQVRQCQPEP